MLDVPWFCDMVKTEEPHKIPRGKQHKEGYHEGDLDHFGNGLGGADGQ